MSGGKYIEIAGGSITETYEGDYEMFAENIYFIAAKQVTSTGVENGTSYGVPKSPPKIEKPENIVFRSCIQFYRSKEHSEGKYGNKDLSYKGEFGFDKFDKKVCAEGLIGEYEELNSIIPKEETINNVQKYLCSYLSIWPPNVEGNLNNTKNKVTLFVKAEKALIEFGKTYDVEFKSSDANIVINGSSVVNLTIDGEAKPLTIECKGTFEKDVTIVARAKGEFEELGKLIIKANAVRYKTIIQPVELVFGATENFAIPDMLHTSFIQNLVNDFNNKSFNQAYIYGELAPTTKKIALQKSEFEKEGLLSTKEDGKLYLKKDSEDDESTKTYNKKVEQRFSASLIKGGIAKDKAKEKLQKSIVEVLTQFDKEYSFKKDGDTKYTLKQYQNKIATTAWNKPNVQKAYQDYTTAKANYDTFGSDDISLNKDKKLHFFYTNSIHGAKNPNEKVLAYSELSSGVAHIFESALTSPDASTVILHELGHSLGLEHSFDKDKLGTYAIKENSKKYKDDIDKEIEFLRGDGKNNDGEIKRLENQKKNIEKNQKTNVNQNEISTLLNLKVRYSTLQRCIDFKNNISIKEFEVNFIENLNANIDSAIVIEANSLDVVSDKKSMSITEIDLKINQANEKLEKLKIERKNAEEAKILEKGKQQSRTNENYMDYYQDSNGNSNPDFERKSYYQWQWIQLQETGNQNKYLQEIK
jgi:hypothetical protein